MLLKTIELMNFRNYNELSLTFNQPLNIFVGSNAQGKTNLLEAIFFLATTKSHRAKNDKELIRWGESDSSVTGSLDFTHRSSLRMRVALTGSGKKKANLNHLEQKKLSDYVGHLNVVLFSPEDLSLVKGTPSQRRRFLDMEIAQVSPSYLHSLLQYNRLIQQKNRILKEKERHQDADLLEVYNEQLISYGVKIIQKRVEFIQKLQVWAKKIHSDITEEKEELLLNYKSNLRQVSLATHEIEESFQRQLEEQKRQEWHRGVSLVGPHRDDLGFLINNMDVQTFGSQGQQRTVALSLKLAEIELIYEEVNDYPLLLLDDVLSELDSLRQSQLVSSFQEKVQTFVTTTSIESLQRYALSHAALFGVQSGKLDRK